MTDFNKSRLVEKFAFCFFEGSSEFENLARKLGEKSFFITGGSGLFGSWILAFFKWARVKHLDEPSVTLLARKKTPQILRSWKVIHGDISNFEYSNLNPDYIIHMAAPSASETFQGMDELAKFDMLLQGVKHVMNFSRHRNSVRTLVLSSGAIYGGFDIDRSMAISELERQAPNYVTSFQGLGIGKRA